MSNQPEMRVKLGFVGCGTIAAAMVTGLRQAGRQDTILLSPRSHTVSAALAREFSGVRVAADNQAVLDGCETIVLAVRPQILEEVLSGLRFRPDHHVLSLVATVSLDYLKSKTVPAGKVTRAVPLPSVAQRRGPTVIFPLDNEVEDLFNALGTAIPLEQESAFDVFTAASGAMASYFAFAGAIGDWMTDNGVNAASARTYVAAMLGGLAITSLTEAQKSFETLSQEHQTAGGLNEQMVRQLRAQGMFKEIAAALDGILKRLRPG